MANMLNGPTVYFFLLIRCESVQLVPAPDWSSKWYDWQGKRKYSEKTCQSAALFTTNPT
jgi:hypothetical protein